MHRRSSRDVDIQARWIGGLSGSSSTRCCSVLHPSRARTAMLRSPTSCEMMCHSQSTLHLLKSQSQSIYIYVRVVSTLISFSSLCKSLIRKLLIKDENRRLGARAGASDVKGHPFFRTTQWALIRHMKPPMIPHQGRGIDTVNFRNVKESESVDISGGRAISTMPKGVPLDSGLATPSGEVVVDPFEEFNSVTLHHDGDEPQHEDLHNGRYDD